MMKNSIKGSVTVTAAIFTAIGMVLTVSYLKYAIDDRNLNDYNIAREKALLMAESAIHFESVPNLGAFSQDTSLVPAWESKAYPFLPQMESDMGTYSDIRCSTFMRGTKTVYYSRATGESFINNIDGEPTKATRQVEIEMSGEHFSDYMYLTDSEVPGGGPGTDGSSVNFGQNDVLEGKVFTNGKMKMSSYGCPEFAGDDNSEVNAADGIAWGICDSSIFSGKWDDEADSIPYPPDASIDLLINNADYIFTADDLLYRGNAKDSLIMTEIVFSPGGFTAKQWAYVIPPISADGPEMVSYFWNSDTDMAGMASGQAGFEDSFNSSTGYLSVDTLTVSVNDFADNYIDGELSQYQVGDTLFVTSANTDSNKVWYGIILSVSAYVTHYTFVVGFYQQDFQAGSPGFLAGELVNFHYLAPLAGGSFNRFAYYHNHPDDGNSMCSAAGLHSFDFQAPPDDECILPPTTFMTFQPMIIHVQNGQVLVRGTIEGQYTIVTSENPTPYRRHDDATIWDQVYPNIWLTDDLVYADSDPTTGEVLPGSANRAGLIAGGNIIIANTRANGAGNQSYGADIKINAALMALDESFVAHYWQNTTSGYYNANPANPFASLADGRGIRRIFGPFGTGTGTSDIRGIVYFWGSMNQSKRGFMKRNAPGPYSIGPGIGYDKDYHFDYNLWISPPPMYPITADSDGNKKLTIDSYGEIPVKRYRNSFGSE